MNNISTQNLESIVSHLALGKLLNSIQLQGGDVNKTFKLETSNGNFTLRLNEPSEIETFKKEAFCYEQAEKIGILSPKVIRIGEFQEKIFMLLEFIEGKTGDKSDNKEANWRKLGEYAERISKIKRLLDSVIQTEETASRWFQNKYLDYNIRELDGDDFFKQEELISDNQASQIADLFKNLKNQNFKFGLVHGDLSYSNFIEADNEEIYLIDWGSAELHVVPHFEIMLKYKRTLIEPEFKKDYLEAFIEGMGRNSDFIELNSEILKSLTLIYIMDKMRWARDHNEDKVFSEYLNEFKIILPRFDI